jgi:uncharacterized membrane protein
MEEVMKQGKRKKLMVALVVALVVVSVCSIAYAFTIPTSGTGYELYDLIVNQYILGPIGAAAGIVMLTTGAIGATMGKLGAAAWPLVGGGMLVIAPKLAGSLGMLF